MQLKCNIDKINNILSELPEFLYHGRAGPRIKPEDFKIVIYENEESAAGKSFMETRTNLDFAFHGFYLTPCEALARLWAFAKNPKENECYQVLVFRVNYDVLPELSRKLLICPDADWAEYIYQCRGRINKNNEYDFIYGFIADGLMSEIEPKIKSGYYTHNPSKFHRDIMKVKYRPFLNDFYGKRKLNCNELIRTCGLDEYQNYQVCITSQKALKMIDVIDIIEIPYDAEIPNDIRIDVDLKEFKKLVPIELINLVREG